MYINDNNNLYITDLGKLFKTYYQILYHYNSH